MRRAEGRDAGALAALLRALNAGPGLHPERANAQGVARDLIGDWWPSAGGAAEADMLQGFVMGDLHASPKARRQGLGRAAAEDGGEFPCWDADEADGLAPAFHCGIGATGARMHSFPIEGSAFAGLSRP